jgi:hypothetical protein
MIVVGGPMSRRVFLAVACALAGCSERHSDDTPTSLGGADDEPPLAAPPPPARTPHVADRARAACTDPVLHYDGGLSKGWLCRHEALALGLTLVDLSEKWAPRPFGPTADGKAPKFRDTYLALAAEEDPDGGELRTEERLVEMYGITPAPSIVLRRLSDERRHSCHDQIDDSALALVTRTVKEAPNGVVDFRERKRKWLGVFLEKERKRRKLPDIAALGKLKSYQHEVKVWQQLDNEHKAVKAAQEHLICDGLLAKKWTDGRLIWMTADRLDFYQRSHFLLPHGELDADTREALASGGLELDFRAALRLLRERVVDATGLIEDGSAGAGPVPVLGRELEPAVMRAAKGHKPMPYAAPDLIGPATETAAHALGWVNPASTRDFLVRHKDEQVIVAIALPPPPAYHSTHMDLRAVIERGDVWYDLKPRFHTPKVRPALVLYTRDGDHEIPLVRWPTTIGGWADEVMPWGAVKKKWKESDVGKRVWKELYVAPTWQPPATTPDDDLVKNLWNGKFRLKTEVFGPGPRSAYGMVMLINHRPVKVSKTKTYWADNGIRVHGTSGVTSVIRGSSHGCHRLLNHLAVRLGGFLLRHRDHVVRGDQKDIYRRTVRHKSGTYPVKVNTRGFLYELTPPVPVHVTKGNIKSQRKRPPPK